jgi:hypothetical protein
VDVTDPVTLQKKIAVFYYFQKRAKNLEKDYLSGHLIIQKTEDRRQKTGDRRQETEDRRRETEDRRRETEDRRRETDHRGLRAED